MPKDVPTQQIVISLLFALSLIGSLPAYGANDLNQQIELLSKKLASAAKGDVVKGNETQVYISLGQLQGILPGNKFEIIREGEPLKVGDEVIGYEETRVAEVEVERARDKVSICKVLDKTDIPKSGDKAYQLRKKINTLVVGQFSYNQGFNRLTKSLQEKLVTTMANRGMKVVERDQLERVLKEQKLGYSGLVNMSSAKKIGELLGAEGMLLGTISDMGNAITINARLVDIESGNAVSASEVELPKTPLIAQLLEIAVEAGNEPYVPTSESPGSPGKKKKTTQIKDAEDFTFNLQKCKKSGQNITCRFLVTNNGSDRKLILNTGSRMFDNQGNAYDGNRVQLANCDNGNSCGMTLISGIPTKATVSFNKVASDATFAAVLELKCHSSSWFNVQYRNVTFKD